MRLDAIVEQSCRRAGVGPNDSLRETAPDIVNDALREFTMRNQAGWDWLKRTVTLTLVADQTEYAWSAIEALADVNEALADRLYPLIRIRTVTAVLASGARRGFPRWTRSDLQEHCYNGWATEGRTFYLWPTPADGETLELRLLLGERTLLDADDEPLCPDLFIGGVLHLARAMLYEEKQDDDRAAAARRQFESEVTRAIGYARPSGGPGRLTESPV